MPKAILEFNLPEEQDEYKTAVNAGTFRYAIYEFDQWLRQKVKYGTDPKEWPAAKDYEYFDVPPPDLPPYNEYIATYFFELVREKLWQKLRDEDLSLE